MAGIKASDPKREKSEVKKIKNIKKITHKHLRTNQQAKSGNG